jgi:transposase
VDREGLEEEQVTSLLPLLAWARFDTASDQAEAERAVELATTSVERARSQNDLIALADALRVQGRLLCALGRAEEALAALRDAIALGQSLPCPQSEARALYELGMFARQIGRLAEDRASERSGIDQSNTMVHGSEHLVAALAIFERLGAKHDARMVRSALDSKSEAGARRRFKVSAIIHDPVHHALSDEDWERIETLLPRASRTGRPRANERLVIEGILYVLETGCRWQDMPRTFGSHVTAWRRYRQLQVAGVWQPMQDVILAPDRSREAHGVLK